MSPRRGLRPALLLVLIALVATSCDQWAGVGYGPARTGLNPVESELGVTEVGELSESWSATVAPGFGQPVIAGDRVLLAAGELTAYDLDPGAACSGTPTVCDPVWRSSTGGLSFVTVAGDVAYAVGSGELRAYDAGGVEGCSGTPTVCDPLWTASIGSGASSPAVTHDTVYVTGDVLYAFDAAGVEGCSGTPTVCQPRWRSTQPSTGGAAVDRGVAFVVSGESILAYDAFGTEGCAGSPTTCEPLRTYVPNPDSECWPYGCNFQGPPTAAGGALYVASTLCCSMATGAVLLHSFDATGAVGCSGSPVVCTPTDYASVPAAPMGVPPSVDAPVAVANGVVYVTAERTSAFDATTLDRLWTTTTGMSGAAIADGVMHTLALQSDAGVLKLRAQAHDAAGSIGCTGSPGQCTPLWSSPLSGGVTFTGITTITSPAVAGGHLAIRTDRLQVFDRS